MPTAQKFHNRGRGNGFPFCLTRVDVDDYDYWVTLGGTKKGDSLSGPTFEAQKFLSRNNAMKLYWSIYSISGTVTAFDKNAPTTRVTVTDANIQDDGDFPDSENFQPYKKTCYDTQSVENWGFSKNELVDGYGAWSEGFISALIQIDFRNNFVRMYNNGEFLGIGIEEITIGSAAQDGGSFTTTADVYISSFGNNNIFNPDIGEIGYKQLSGIDFVAKREALESTENSFDDFEAVSKSLDADSGELTSERSVKITGLNFYTYP